VKRVDLLRRLRKGGFTVSSQGRRHEIWSNGLVKVAVPRHREIREGTARAILRDAGLP